MTDRNEWVQFAACATAWPDAFFPDQGDPVNAAKRVCESCPVRRICLQEALDNDEEYGVWGGLSAHQRKQLRATNGAPA